MTEVEIIVINGIGGSGKSSFIQACINYCNYLGNVACTELSMVDYVKEVATYIGWEGTKSAKDRIFLSDLKLAMERWNNVPFKKLEQNIQTFIDSQPNKTNILFVNSRELEDIKSILEWSESKGYLSRVLEVIRPDSENNEVPMLVDQINQLQPDDIIMNNGTFVSLTGKAEKYIHTLLKTWENQDEHIQL